MDKQILMSNQKMGAKKLKQKILIPGKNFDGSIATF